MTEKDVLDDTWADEIFERARTSPFEPHWIPDAAGAARLGNRRRRLNRVATAATAVLVAGVVTTQFTTFDKWGSDATTAASGGAANSSKPSPKPPSPQPGTKPASALAEYLQIRTAQGLPLSEPSAQTLDSLVKAIDPTGAHLRQNLPPTHLITPVIGGVDNADDLDAYGLWTPDGDGAKPYSGQRTDSKPYGQISITMLSHPGSLPPSSDCGYADLPSSDGFSENAQVASAPCQVRHLADGSKVITAHTTNLGARQAITSTRVYPDGRQIRVCVVNWVQYVTATHLPEQLILGSAPDRTDGTPVQPVPWTDQQLSDALSAPDIKIQH